MKRKLFTVILAIIMAVYFGTLVTCKQVPPKPIELSVFGQMNGYSVSMFYRQFNEARVTGVKEVKIFIMSPGGIVVETFALCDMIKKAQADGIHVTTIAYGMVASAAVPVFLCGDTRTAGPNTVFMLHKPDLAICGEDEDCLELYAMDEKLYIQLIVDHCNLTHKEVDELCAAYTWFTAKEAMRYGMVDRIE